MRGSLILLSTICLTLAVEAKSAVNKGEVEIEILGGWSMENSADLGNDLDSIESGATGADLDGWFASAGLGWFTSKHFQLGLAGFGMWADGSGSTTVVPAPAFPTTREVYDLDVDATIYGAGGRAKWHFFPQKKLVPYVGLQVFWATADVDVSGTVSLIVDDEVTDTADISGNDKPSGILWGPIVGLRFQTGEYDELFLEYQYHLWSGSVSDVIDDGHTITVGLSHRLK